MNANAANYDPTGQGASGSGTDGASAGDVYSMYNAGGYDAGLKGQQQEILDSRHAVDGGGYGDPSTAAYYSSEDGYYPQQEYSASDPTYAEQWNLASGAQDMAAVTEPGFYYPTNPLQPQLYGAPVSAIAFDDGYNAMYVASVSQSMSAGRRLGHRASMLVAHSTTDGMLYSSVAGHPEAPSKVLAHIYETLYGKASPHATAMQSLPAGRRSVPSHAYKPPHGTSDVSGLTNNVYEMGINTLLPATEGYVASVSPSGVRLHATGGLQVADYHVEGMLCGTAHPSHDPAVLSHVAVAGVAMGVAGNHSNNKQHIFCMDVWQGLRTVSSYSLDRRAYATMSGSVAVTAMATSHSRGSIIAGCSDGQIRLLDSRLRELAKLKSHYGGVVDVAVSQDGMLLATTGYGSRASRNINNPLYSFPDPTVFVYDIRYLGRGGIPHPFAGLRGGPRHLAFMPDVDGQPSNRLVVASGQSGGGLQIVVPFEEASGGAGSFILPQMDLPGESISTMCISEENLALGTSKGNVLKYRLAGFDKKAAGSARMKDRLFVPPSGSSSPKFGGGSYEKGGGKAKEKRPLEMPPFEPPIPSLSLEPRYLQTDDPNSRLGMNDRTKSIFSAYMLCRSPNVSAVGDTHNVAGSSFGALATSPMLAPSRLRVSSDLTSKVTDTVDFIQTVPVSNLEINLLEDHRPERIKARIKKKKDPLPNPNKLLYSNKLNAIAYEPALNRSKLSGKRNSKDGADDSPQIEIPTRYRLTFRPGHKTAGGSSRSDYNTSGFLPGWDYSPTMPNAFVPPVLMLLYFVPEIRSSMLEAQFNDRSVSASKSSDRNLVAELGFLFHRIECLATTGMVFQDSSAVMNRIEPWAPFNFISCLTAMPEAEQLQILDGSPAAVDMPRRPEAFLRFLLYQMDKEVGKGSAPKLMESLGGVDFTSVNEFVSGSGPPSKSSTRSLTIELSYAPFLDTSDKMKSTPSFGEVFRHTLCRETRLRAWNQTSKAYETIVQRKIATSLPKVLSISCGCAGLKDEEGLNLWRSGTGDGGHWLPELVEIELEDSGNVVVRELIREIETGTEEWKEYNGTGSIPSSISELVSKAKVEAGPRKLRYRLEMVLSMVRDDLDRNCPDEVSGMGEEGDAFGHHVLHARVPKHYRKALLTHQRGELERLMSSELVDGESAGLTLATINSSKNVFEKRLEFANQQLNDIDNEKSDWLLINGFVVSKTFIEDAKAFHVKFKEPSIVIFRAIDDQDDDRAAQMFRSASDHDQTLTADVLRTQSITNGSKSPCAASQRLSSLPGRGDLIAFDAEFVSVQDDKSTLTDAGSKVTIRDTRHAVARISIIDCRTREIVLDDHVLPREPVVDYLTRFSGIVAKDLNSKQSPHHLIGTRAAYLKLRFLMERGCIFVGHGLQQDFWTVNLAVPASQIIDTVEIYHKPAQRYVSLRFLTNFVLKRDMQQDVHDSVEDAMAAFELYAKAVELKENGDFEKLLNDLYEFGQKTDWKLGVDHE